VSEVREVFDFSASDNTITPSVPIPVSILSENEMKQHTLPVRSSEARDEFDRSASDSLAVPSIASSFAVFE
jgi:hypothetical protein